MGNTPCIGGNKPDQDNAKVNNAKFGGAHWVKNPLYGPTAQVDDAKEDIAKAAADAKADDAKVDKPQIDDKCDYVPGKLVAGPTVSHGLNNSGLFSK